MFIMSSDVDFEQFIKLLDGALASDDKTIQQALRKFLFVAAMVLGDECEPGPFTKMMETMDSLQRRLATLENQNNTTVADNGWYDTTSSPTFYPFTAPGTGIGVGGSSTSTGTPPNWTNAVSTTTTSGSITNTGTITLNGGTSGYCTPGYLPGTGGTTTTYTFPSFEDSETGTEIKQEIEDALDRLANVA